MISSRPFLTIALILANFASFANSSATTHSTSNADLRFLKERNSYQVLYQNQPILELSQGGYALRFRSLPDNDRWIDTMLKLVRLNNKDQDYKIEDVRYEPTANGFTMVMSVSKGKPSATVTVTVRANLLSPELGYEYELESVLEAKLSELREVLGFRRGKRTLEPFGYFIGRVCKPELLRTRKNRRGFSVIYDGFVRSADAEHWLFSPVLHTPSQMMPEAGWETINYTGNRYRGELPLAEVGSYFGILDSQEGGWMTQIIESNTPQKITLCWMFFDVHHYMFEAVPESTPDDRFQARFAIRFTPMKPQEARDILARAEEVKWKGTKTYELPVFSDYNTFAALIGPKEQSWFRSDFNCFRDDTTGIDDNFSISIKKAPGDNSKSAWYAWAWGTAYDIDHPVEGVYRFSAWIKTEGCEGKVTFSVQEFIGDNFLNAKTGKWSKVNFGETFADIELTGTNDWTHVTIDLEIDNQKVAKIEGRESPSHMGTRRSVVIQQTGPGQCWIDNVTIHKLERAP